MELEISDQYDSVSEFMASLLIEAERNEDAEKLANREKRQVSVRIPMHAYEKLTSLAGEVGETPTAMAAAFLELAIYEADGVQLTGSTKEPSE